MLKRFNVQIADHDLINKFIIHRFNQYVVLNAKDCLWNYIQIDFGKFEVKHFDDIDDSTWTIVRNYCYLHKYWIDYNFAPVRTCATTMMKTINKEWNNKWSLEQIS